MIISGDVQAQRVRIARATSALYELMYSLDTDEGQLSDNEWMVVLAEAVSNMTKRRLKYARMARKKWSGE